MMEDALSDRMDMGGFLRLAKHVLHGLLQYGGAWRLLPSCGTFTFVLIRSYCLFSRIYSSWRAEDNTQNLHTNIFRVWLTYILSGHPDLPIWLAVIRYVLNLHLHIN